MDVKDRNALLLRMNKEEQVAALISLGFEGVTVDTPARQIADYIRWAGGLLDLSIAAISIQNKTHAFFTADEWNSMSANNRSKYVRIGIRIRAEAKQFVISKSYCLNDSGARTFKWGAYGTDIKGLKNYGAGNQGLYDDFSGKANTAIILDATAGVLDNTGVVGAPAAEAAAAYRACTVESDGIDDITEWHLGGFGEMLMMAKYKIEINNLMTSVYGLGNILTNDWHWCSSEWDSASAWVVYFNGGNAIISGKTFAYAVRAVSATEILVYDIPFFQFLKLSKTVIRRRVVIRIVSILNANIRLN